jgi:predicted O-methyltransferase YrrM
MDPYATHLPFLKKILQEHDIQSVFEFGCGNYSTLLFAEKCKNVISIEMQNKEWYDQLKTKIPKNVHLLFQLGPEQAITTLWSLGQSGAKFDLIFVDGHGDSRWKAINAASQYTSIIVAHDTQFPGYQWNKVKLDNSWKEIVDTSFTTYTTMWKK